MKIATTINLSIIVLYNTLLMIFTGTASFVSSNYYHTVYAAAKNVTKNTSSSSKGGGNNTFTTKKTKSALRINGFVKE